MNPEVFLEPEEGNPELWMDASKEELVEMRHWFWASGSGGGCVLEITLRFSVSYSFRLSC